MKINKRFSLALIFIISLSLISPGIWYNNLNQELQAFYNFEETSGQIYSDYSSLLNGTMDFDISSIFVPGKVGNAINTTEANLNLTEHRSEILVSGPSGVSTVQYRPGSTALWFYKTGGSGRESYLISKEEPGIIVNYNIKFNASGQLIIDANSGGLGDTDEYVDGFSFNNWYFLVHNWNGSVWDIYVNGQLNKSVEKTRWPTDRFSHLRIGAQATNPNSLNFSGYIDELMFFNRTLTEGEISLLWNNGNGLSDPIDFKFINITSPINNQNLTSNSFNLNATINQTSASLVNASFFINDIFNSTSEISGNSNQTSWTLNLQDGFYNLSVQACDSEGDCGFSQINSSIKIDTGGPFQEILSPASSISTASFNLILNASDPSGLSSCYYNVTRGASLEITNTELNISNLSSSGILSSQADYVLRTWCNDTLNLASNLDFNFTYSSSPGGSSGGGGGGGGGFFPESLDVEVENPICLGFQEAFRSAFNNAEQNNFASEYLSPLWKGFWDYILCRSASSIVPV